MAAQFNPPPGWPVPRGWIPPNGWQPDPSWPPAPPGWAFWVQPRPRKGHRLLIGLGVTGLAIAAITAMAVAGREMAPTHTDVYLKQLVATLGPACAGQPVPQARAFTGQPPLRLIMLDDQGAASDDTEASLPDVWTVDQIELVICASPPTDEQVSTCFYQDSDYKILRYARVVKYQAVVARTGVVIVIDEIRALPDECPSSVSSARGEGTSYGNLGNYSTVQEAVERQVADATAAGTFAPSATPTP
jgi:hypothetical protein